MSRPAPRGGIGNPGPRDRGRRGRRGIALIAAMACLVLIAMVLGVLLRQTAAARRRARAEERRGQAAWLAESGLERAAARLAADPGYRGETWIVPAGEIGGRDDAEIRIEVARVPGREGARRLRASADYPRDPWRRARETREADHDLER